MKRILSSLALTLLSAAILPSQLYAFNPTASFKVRDGLNPPTDIKSPDPLSSLPRNTFNNIVNSLDIPGKDTEAFIEPSAEQLANMTTIVQEILEGKIPDQSLLDSVDYTLYNITSQGVERLALVHNANNGGTFFFNLSTPSDVVIQAPHPIYEELTVEEGANFFTNLNAMAFMIAGTHRCANADFTDCDGSTEVCGGPSFRVSDVAHYPANYFHQVTMTIADFVPSRFVQLHGFKSVNADVIVSTGNTDDFPNNVLVNRLAANLDVEFPGKDVRSCNRAGDNDDNLCAEVNLQGRYLNGSANACSNSAPNTSHRFLHIEQHVDFKDPANWPKILSALQLAL